MWRKLGPGCLALGRAIRRLLDRFAGSGLNRKPLGFLVARLMWKSKGLFGNKILETEYDYDSIFFNNKSYFIQLFLNKS
jgi:hypothetical protein